MPVLNLSNELWCLINRYEAQLSALEDTIKKDRNTLPNVCQDSECSYIDQHFQHMLEDIQQQRRWCKKIYRIY